MGGVIEGRSFFFCWIVSPQGAVVGEAMDRKGDS